MVVHRENRTGEPGPVRGRWTRCPIMRWALAQLVGRLCKTDPLVCLSEEYQI